MHLYKLRSFYLPREPLLDLVINHIAKKSKQKIGYYIIYQYSDFHRRFRTVYCYVGTLPL